MLSIPISKIYFILNGDAEISLYNWKIILGSPRNVEFINKIFEMHDLPKIDLLAEQKTLANELEILKSDTHLMQPILSESDIEVEDKDKIFIARGCKLEEMVIEEIKQKEKDVQFQTQKSCKQKFEKYRIGGKTDLISESGDVIYEVKIRRNKLVVFNSDIVQLSFYVYILKATKGIIVAYYKGNYEYKEMSYEECEVVVKKKMKILDRVIHNKLKEMEDKKRCIQFLKRAKILT